MRRLIINVWLRISKIKDRIFKRHNVEIVEYKAPINDLEIEEALTLTLEHEEEIKKAFEEEEIPFSEEPLVFNESEVLKDLKELSDKLIGIKFKVLKGIMSKKHFKAFKRSYNRNKLYMKLKAKGRKL